MSEKWTCPRAAERTQPPQDGDLVDEACSECPYLLKQIDERGAAELFCLVYRNRFRSPGPAIEVVAPPRSEATWSRERLDQP
jgi:hypothetical protein